MLNGDLTLVATFQSLATEKILVKIKGSLEREKEKNVCGERACKKTENESKWGENKQKALYACMILPNSCYCFSFSILLLIKFS